MTGLSTTVEFKDDAVLNVCAAPTTSCGEPTFATGADSLDTARDVAVELSGRCGVVLGVLSERDLPLGAVLDSFGVVSSGMDGSVMVPVVVEEPAEVEVTIDVDVDEEPSVVDGVEDAAELVVPVFRPAVDEFVDDPWLTDPADVVSEDDELDGSAPAIP